MDKTEIKKQVGIKVKMYRLDMKLSQFALGEKVGVNQRQIAQIECGKSLPSLKTLINLSKIFKCDISDFFEPKEKLSLEDLKNEIYFLLERFDYPQLMLLHSFIKQFSLINTEVKMLNKEKKC